MIDIEKLKDIIQSYCAACDTESNEYNEGFQACGMMILKEVEKLSEECLNKGIADAVRDQVFKYIMMKSSINGTYVAGELADGTPVNHIEIDDPMNLKQDDKVKVIIIKQD